MTLPKPIWSNGDIAVAQKVVTNPSSRAWTTWNKNHTKIAVLRAMVSCQIRIGLFGNYFGWDMGRALTQNLVRFLHSYSLGVHYQTLVRNFNPPLPSLRPCPDILTSGDHLLVTSRRKTMKNFSADQSRHTW